MDLCVKAVLAVLVGEVSRVHMEQILLPFQSIRSGGNMSLWVRESGDSLKNTTRKMYSPDAVSSFVCSLFISSKSVLRSTTRGGGKEMHNYYAEMGREVPENNSISTNTTTNEDNRIYCLSTDSRRFLLRKSRTRPVRKSTVEKCDSRDRAAVHCVERLSHSLIAQLQ